jgi:hypothetical protein
MFRSWGFTGSENLLISITGLWKSLMKLGLPVVALALVAINGVIPVSRRPVLPRYSPESAVQVLG